MTKTYSLTFYSKSIAIMGFMSYFKPKAAASSAASKSSPAGEAELEKAPPSPVHPAHDPDLLSTPRFGSSGNSMSGRSFQSSHMEDIKHEVMVNYLYQQQCSHLWVSDQSGHLEGVLLRKNRGNYMACPPDLAGSEFLRACSVLNVHVRFPRLWHLPFRNPLSIFGSTLTSLHRLP